MGGKAQLANAQYRRRGDQRGQQECGPFGAEHRHQRIDKQILAQIADQRPIERIITPKKFRLLPEHHHMISADVTEKIGLWRQRRQQERQQRQKRSEEHTSELQSLMRTSYAVSGWKKNKI